MGSNPILLEEVRGLKVPVVYSIKVTPESRAHVLVN